MWLCIFALLLALAHFSPIDEIVYTDSIGNPTIKSNIVPKKTVKKLVGETYVQNFDLVSFEISSKIFVTDGKVDDDHNSSAYSSGSEQNNCRIYPTDFQFNSKTGIALQSRPIRVTVVPDQQDPKHSVKGYASFFNGSVVEFSATNSQRVGLKKIEQKIQKITEIKLQGHEHQTINILNLNNEVYFVTKDAIIHYDVNSKKLENVTGYEGHPKLVRAREMKGKDPQVSEFYALTNDQLFVYQIKSKNQVTLQLTVSNIGDPTISPIGNIYDKNYFYIASYEKIFVVDISLRSSPKIHFLRVNGTCFDIEKDLSTLHVSCLYHRNHYLIQFYALGTKLTLNRYYTDIQLPDTTWVRKIEDSTMAIVGGDEIRLVNYGVNRNVLLDLHERQPNFNFYFKDGIDVIPIQSFQEGQSVTMLGVFRDRIQLLKLNRQPAQLYCEFPEEKAGSVYTILAQFNSSKCYSNTDEEKGVFGSLEQICQIKIPLEITSVDKMMNNKEGNLISGGLILVVVIALIILVAFAVRALKSKEYRISALIKKLENAKKKGYASDPKPI